MIVKYDTATSVPTVDSVIVRRWWGQRLISMAWSVPAAEFRLMGTGRDSTLATTSHTDVILMRALQNSLSGGPMMLRDWLSIGISVQSPDQPRDSAAATRMTQHEKVIDG